MPHLYLGSTRSAHIWSSCACTPHPFHPFNPTCSQTPNMSTAVSSANRAAFLMPCRPSFVAKSFRCTAAAVVVDTGVNYKYVCAKQISPTTPNEITNKQQCTSTTKPGANNFSNFYDVLYLLLLQIRAQYFPQLKTVGRAETFVSWPSEKDVNSKLKAKTKTWPWLIGSRLS